MIDRLTIEKILDAANIVDVVGDFVTLKRAGANYKGLCPFHDDRTPSFMVSPAKNYCKCFACGKGGTPVGFIMEHEQLSYPDALRWLAKKYGITIEEKEMTEEEKVSKGERDSMFIVNEWANKWFQEQLRQTPDGRAIGLSYFRGRGFRDDTIEKFQLGYSPKNREACTQAALKAGYQEQFLISTPDKEGIAHGVGISIKREDGTMFDRFAGRVMFPIFTVSGKVVGFGGRVLDAATKGVNVKYQNSPESIIYHKKSELYGLFQAKQAITKNDCVYLVEGYTDVISMHQSGIENVVASSGTALTHEQIKLVRRFTSNIVVLYDGDAAGIKASQRGIDMLLREGMNVKLMLLPDGKDPDDFAREHTTQELQEYMQTNQVDFIRFKTDLLMKEAEGDPIKLSRLVNNIVQSISVIPDEITRTIYIRETAQLMQLKEQLIADAVAKQIRINVEEWRKEREREERRSNLQNGAAATQTPITQHQSPNTQHPAPNTQHPAPSTQHPAPSTPEDDRFGEFIPPEDIYEAYSGNGAGLSPAAMIQPSGVMLGNNPVTNDKKTSSAIETLIIQAIIRYGEQVICNAEDETGQPQPLSVIEYVFYSLQQDDLAFSTPIYQQVLVQGMEHVHDEGFKAERYFLRHREQEINQLAFELAEDKEQLSRVFKDPESDSEQRKYTMLMELTTHLLTDFKLHVVKQKRDELMNQMRNPEILKDREKLRAIMEEMQVVKEQEKRLAKECGDRVLTK